MVQAAMGRVTKAVREAKVVSQTQATAAQDKSREVPVGLMELAARFVSNILVVDET